MTSGINEILVVVPHRISGFFQIVDEINGVRISNPEKIGSRGAGLTLTAYGYTRISVQDRENSNENEIKILINGKKENENAETTYYIYKYISKFFKKTVKLTIDHHFDLPVGCGFGASGAGAIGASLGINYLMDLNLTYNDAGRIAHIAEVESKTGLGTVAGLWHGGLSIVLKAGYPFFIDKIFYPLDLKVNCCTFGEILTKSILSDPILSLKIKKAGEKAMNNLLKTPNIFTFMDESINFVNNIDILNLFNLSECQELMNSLNKIKNVKASMNQLGKSIFSIFRPEQFKEVHEIYESYKPRIKIYDLEICPYGPVIQKLKIKKF
jgi:pantoate kinase